MPQFRKRPVDVEAVQWNENWPTMLAFIVEQGGRAHIDFDGTVLVVETLEGDMRANAGDWIIRGVQGEFYPCKPDIFAATYDAI